MTHAHLRTFFLGVAVLSLFMTSCKKENQLSVSGPTFSYSVESMVDEDGTKTIFDTNNRTFAWKTSDKIRIYDANFSHIVYVDDQADGTRTSFRHLVPSTDPRDVTEYNSLADPSVYYAFYPSYYVVRNGNEFEYTLQTKQTLDNNDDIDKVTQLHLTRFPMAYKTSGSNHTLKMMSLCGALRLFFQNDNATIKSIKFETLGEQQVSGKFNVSFADDGNPTLVPIASELSYRTKCVTLELNQAVSIKGGRNFYIALPPNTYNGFMLTIVSGDNKTCKLKYSTTNLRINQNRIVSLTRTGKQLKFKDTFGKFTVSQDENGNPKKVYISPGNLQYCNNNWQFASQQYELIHNNGTYNPAATSRWDMFYWSMNNSDYGRSTSSDDYELTTLNAQFKDWGEVFGASSPWFTLSKTQWDTLLGIRQTSLTIGNTSNVRYAAAGIRMTRIWHSYESESSPSYWTNGTWYEGYIPGILIFPDDFSIDQWPSGVPYPQHLNGTGTWPNLYGGDEKYTQEQFAQLEAAGVIFLPMTGSGTIGGSISNMNVQGYNSENSTDARLAYWTSTNYAVNQHGNQGETSSAYWYYIDQHQNSYNMAGNPRMGLAAVRLVRWAEE